MGSVEREPPERGRVWRVFDRIDKGVGYLSAGAAILAAVAALTVLGAIGLDVTRRAFVGGSVPGLFEFVETLMVIIVFLGIAYGERSETHVRVTAVTRMLPPRVREVVRSVAFLAAAVICAWFLLRTGQRAIASARVGEARHGILRFPIWPARIVIVVGFSLLLAEFILKLTRTIHVIYRGVRAP